VSITQLLGAVIYTIILLGFNGLYATLVCIACSQLEKLRASLLDIRQRHVTSEQDLGAESDQEEAQGQEKEQVHTSQEVFHHMQKRLNDCIHHHQQILRYIFF
jgi:type VI protein secretion system component VasF